MIYPAYQWGGVYSKSEVDTLLTGKADTSHTHTKSQITDFPTIPSKTSDLTNDLGFISSEIDSSGTGWVRFKSGLQICYGGVSNINNVATGRTRFSFSVPFNEIPSIVTTPAIEYLYMITVVSESVTNGILSVFDGTDGSLRYTTNGIVVNYVAIGKWK